VPGYPATGPSPYRRIRTEAAEREGKVLVISGDHLDITAAGLGLDGTAPLGTVATGYAHVRT
jgi:hypothetical protein